MKGPHLDPIVDIVGLLGALGGSMAGLAAIINVLHNHPGTLTPKQQTELDEIKARLDRFLTEEEQIVGKHRGPNGAPTIR